MPEDIFGRTSGYVHTAEIAVHWREGIDVEVKRSDRKRITKWNPGQNGGRRPATMRFNPNKEKVCSPYSGNMVNRGNCRSLADFENLLESWAISTDLQRDDVKVTRADFALDCFAEEDAAVFRKLCDLMIAAFCVRHDIECKHQYWGETIISMQPKNCKAVHGQIAMERYNKSLQQPSNGAIWRTELRFTKDTKHPEKEQPQTIQAMLEALTDELCGLPAFYEEAQERLNDALFARYTALQNGSEDHIKINQFLYQNNDRVFSRAQVRDFFLRLGVTDNKRRTDCADNYSRRYAHLYTSKAQFTLFIEWVISEVEKWVTNDPFWTRKNDDQNEEKDA